jgi:hypothetical protein
MWPLHNQSYCHISMKNGSNVIITWYKISAYWKNNSQKKPYNTVFHDN